MAIITVKGARNLQVGDFLDDNSMVLAVWDGPEGTWLETDDGSAGYVFNENQTYVVDRYYAGE